MSAPSFEARVEASAGGSSPEIYEAAVALLDEVGAKARLLVDVGCGKGAFRTYLGDRCDRYVGADAARHGASEDFEFIPVNLDTGRIEIEDGRAEVVTCLETIEHVENPRALVRELRRVVTPGGFVLVSTPNQLSVLSKVGLLLKNEFVHFQERPGLYPAHISALLEVDLVRMFREAGYLDLRVRYTGVGRIPFTGWHWPPSISARAGHRGRAFSDNVLIIGRTPRRTQGH